MSQMKLISDANNVALSLNKFHFFFLHSSLHTMTQFHVVLSPQVSCTMVRNQHPVFQINGFDTFLDLV